VSWMSCCPPPAISWEQHANNPIEVKRLRSACVISTGHAFVQYLRRGHYELAVDVDPNHRFPAPNLPASI
jgi:hypothetical protein